jgi:hypothetical protein
METKYMHKEWLTEQFVELGKTSRQISKEFKVSRKIVNVCLLNFGLITRDDLEENDLP